MRSIYWQAMPKVKKKNDKQRQRLDKVHKRDDRATNDKAVSKTCFEKSSIPSVDVHVANNQIILMGHRTCRIGVNYRVKILQPLILRTCLQRHRQLLINIYSHRKIADQLLTGPRKNIQIVKVQGNEATIQCRTLCVLSNRKPIVHLWLTNASMIPVLADLVNGLTPVLR